MSKKLFKFTVIMVVLVFSLSMTAVAQDEEESDFKGGFTFGYRTVSTDGQMNKYKEDINLDSGFRLFNLNLHYTPSGALKKILDRVDLYVYNLGGDPFESFSLSAQKYGKFQFKYDRRKSEYFYADMYEIGGGHQYDMHTFDYMRVMDSGMFKYTFSKNITFFVNFDRYTREGESTTSLDINRIEFEFDKPIKEKSTRGSIGLDVHFNRFSFLFEETLIDFENANSYFLPGMADGGSGSHYPSTLSLFYINQPYDLEGNIHSFKATARPFNNLFLSGALKMFNQDMSINYWEEGVGTNYVGREFRYGQSGSGSFNRNIDYYDFDLSYLITSKIAVVGAVRYHAFDQSGTFTVDSAEGARIAFNNMGIEGGLQFQPSSAISLTLGYRTEKRELDNPEGEVPELMTVTYEQDTRQNGLFGNFVLKPSRAFSLTFDYQRGSTDDPYTLISPASFTRMRLTAKFKKNAFNAAATYLHAKTVNDVTANDWESSKNQFNLRAGFHTDAFKLFGGISLMNIKQNAVRTIDYPPSWYGAGSFPWIVDYEGKSTLLDVSLSWKAAEGWNIGAYMNSYKNTGFWEIDRTMLKAYIEHVFPNGLVGNVGFRYAKFAEASAPTNDYSANIVELAFGYRWK
jgi:hypothetical protein